MKPAEINTYISEFANKKLSELNDALEAIIRENMYPPVVGELTAEILKHNKIELFIQRDHFFDGQSTYIVKQDGKELGLIKF